MQPRSHPLPVSVWSYKPWWCQPWSILLTAIGLIGASWLLFHWIWLTGLVAIPVLTWLVYFLWVYPKLMAESGLLPTNQVPTNQVPINQAVINAEAPEGGKDSSDRAKP